MSLVVENMARHGMRARECAKNELERLPPLGEQGRRCAAEIEMSEAQDAKGRYRLAFACGNTRDLGFNAFAWNEGGGWACRGFGRQIFYPRAQCGEFLSARAGPAAAEPAQKRRVDRRAIGIAGAYERRIACDCRKIGSRSGVSDLAAGGAVCSEHVAGARCQGFVRARVNGRRTKQEHQSEQPETQAFRAATCLRKYRGTAVHGSGTAPAPHCATYAKHPARSRDRSREWLHEWLGRRRRASRDRVRPQ